MRNTIGFLVLVLLFPGLSQAGLFGSNQVVKATQDRTDCIPDAVQNTLKDVAAKFGTVQIVSGFRSRSDNARRGGADGSQHILCKAADFLIPNRGSKAVQKRLQEFLLAEKEKYGIRYNVYCSGRSHIDNNNRGLPDSYSSCVEREAWHRGARKTYTRSRRQGGR
jgi:hypothetical protein